MAELKKIAIVGSARIPFCRAYTGYAEESNLSMLSTAFAGLADKYGLRGEKIDEVMAGAVIAHSRDFNLAREALLDAGFSPRTPGTNVQIACGTSLQAALMLGSKIATGEIDVAIAGGSDTVSDSPIVVGDKFQHRLIRLNGAKTTGQKLSAFKGFNLGELAPVFGCNRVRIFSYFNAHGQPQQAWQSESLRRLAALRADYVRTARAKRLPDWRVYLLHVLPNALTATLTIGGLLLSAMIAGTVLVENVFAWPGLGQTIVASIVAKDYPVVQGIVLVYGTGVLLVNLVVDIALALLDPRSTIRES